MPRHRKRVSHAKEAFYIICIVIVLLIGLFTYMGPGGYREMKRIQAELSAERSRVDALQKSKQEKMKTIENLRDDRKNNATVEALARKKGYGRPGDLVQEVPNQEKDSSKTRK